jgi:hypothetical protein
MSTTVYCEVCGSECEPNTDDTIYICAKDVDPSEDGFTIPHYVRTVAPDMIVHQFCELQEHIR